MGGCGMDGLMYKKVQPCDFLCHPYAADLIMLTVEVLAGDLEVSASRQCRILIQRWCRHTRGLLKPSRGRDSAYRWHKAQQRAARHVLVLQALWPVVRNP